MIWYYFAIESGVLYLVGDEFFSDRPADANDSGGNPHTPWYQADITLRLRTYSYQSC